MKCKNKIMISDSKYIGIVKAKDWFKGYGFFFDESSNTKPILPPFIRKKSYVIGVWYEYINDLNGSMEGGETLAVLNDYDATLSALKSFYKKYTGIRKNSIVESKHNKLTKYLVTKVYKDCTCNIKTLDNQHEYYHQDISMFKLVN